MSNAPAVAENANAASSTVRKTKASAFQNTAGANPNFHPTSTSVANVMAHATPKNVRLVKDCHL